MDKQFINIDDLVRQRLSGSEEEERSGAWRNMRELLDNEMPQKRVGFFNWRRMFSGMAVLLLLGSISLGGYELSSSVRGTSAKGYATAGKNVVTPVMRAKGSASNSSSDKFDNQSGEASVVNGDQLVQATDQPTGVPANSSVKASQTKSLAANESAPMTGAVVTNTTSNTSVEARNSLNTNNSEESKINNKKSNSNGRNNTLAAAVNNTNTSGVATQSSDNQYKYTPSSSVASTTEDTRTAGVTHPKNTPHHAGHGSGRKVNSTESTSNNGGEQMSSLPLAAGPVAGGHTSGARSLKTSNAPVIAAVAKNATGNGTSSTDAAPRSSTPISLNGTTIQNTASVAGPLKAEKASRHHRNSNGHSTLASNTRVASILSKAAAAKNAAKHSNVHTSSSTAASTVSALAKTDHATSTSLSSSASATPAMAAKTSAIATGAAKVSASRVHPSGSSAATSSALPVGHKPIASIAKAGSSAAPSKPVSEPVTDAAATEERSNVKKIDKLTLVYREQYYQTTNVDGYYKMDTISLLRTGTPDPVKTAAKQNSGSGTNGTNNTSGSTSSNTNKTALAAAPAHSKTSTSTGNRNAANADEQSEEPVANAAPIEPAAAPATTSTTDETAAASPAPVKKELNSTKKSAGASTMDKLNEKFNDLKYHVKGVQFAPGLAAGINSTFFAPESFKGFQFGFTGEFVFSDAVSVMTEVKYFHRINSNYALEDNYYKYTQVGGQYRKELQLNSYSFSTLHSVEMPVAVRYTAGKFSFFAGGNFLYTFSINTGAVTLPGPTPATYVSSIGEDNAPKIAAQDFDSRFGIGYLFGASFQVSPNVIFDIRNAQTVWDNAGTAGAKYVSGQLYKNPSLQVSIGYRFGGKKSED